MFCGLYSGEVNIRERVILTPGPRLVRIPLVRFPLVRIFKKFQNYLAHADSFTGARTSEGMSMREIRDDSFTLVCNHPWMRRHGLQRSC